MIIIDINTFINRAPLMANIKYMWVDGKGILDRLSESIKLIKIIKSDSLLADSLFLVLDKKLYKGPPIRDNSIVDFKWTSIGQKKEEECIDTFYLYKNNAELDTTYLSTKEQELAKDPNNILFCGRSVTPNFLDSYKILMDTITGNELFHNLKGELLKGKTLQEVLIYLMHSLSLNMGKMLHKNLNFKFPYFIPRSPSLNKDGTCTKGIFEELAEIHGAVVNIKNNKLNFLQKMSSNILFRTAINLFPDDIISATYIQSSSHKNNLKYKGVIYSYFEAAPSNIKQSTIGVQPFLELDAIYEQRLAHIYAVLKLREIKAPNILELTINYVCSRDPGYYVIVRESRKKQSSFKKMPDILGTWSVKECIITYGLHEQPNQQDPNEAGPSSKKAKLEPSWYTTLHLIKI